MKHISRIFFILLSTNLFLIKFYSLVASSDILQGDLIHILQSDGTESISIDSTTNEIFTNFVLPSLTLTAGETLVLNANNITWISSNEIPSEGIALLSIDNNGNIRASDIVFDSLEGNILYFMNSDGVEVMTFDTSCNEMAGTSYAPMLTFTGSNVTLNTDNLSWTPSTGLPISGVYVLYVNEDGLIKAGNMNADPVVSVLIEKINNLEKLVNIMNQKIKKMEMKLTKRK